MTGVPLAVFQGQASARPHASRRALTPRRDGGRAGVTLAVAVSVYPSRYQLAELSAHLVSLLERRRGAFERWDAGTEAALAEEAKRAIDEAEQGFKELADDAPYWQRLEQALLTVTLPRYLRLAKEQHALEQRKYDVWRGGDLISRAAYAALGIVTAAIVWRTAIPDWIEPLPLSFFVFGPLIPDLQAWFARRRYAKQLAALVEEMAAEQADARAYQPLGLDAPAPVAEVTSEKGGDAAKEPEAPKDATRG